MCNRINRKEIKMKRNNWIIDTFLLNILLLLKLQSVMHSDICNALCNSFFLEKSNYINVHN